MDAIKIFEYVTFNLSDLISSIEVRYQNGVEKEIQSDKFDLSGVCNFAKNTRLEWIL